MALGEGKMEEEKLSQRHVIHHKLHMEFLGRNPELHGERAVTRYPSDGREQSGIPTVFNGCEFILCLSYLTKLW